jgi:hypothetical protein
MNWSRGLLRVWVVLSLCWSTLWVITAFVENDNRIGAVILALAPHALLALGYGLLWAARGFKQELPMPQ